MKLEIYFTRLIILQMSRDVQTIAMDLELVNWKLAHAFAQDSKGLIVVSVTNYDYIQGNILTK